MLYPRDANTTSVTVFFHSDVQSFVGKGQEVLLESQHVVAVGVITGQAVDFEDLEAFNFRDHAFDNEVFVDGWHVQLDAAVF